MSSSGGIVLICYNTEKRLMKCVVDEGLWKITMRGSRKELTVLSLSAQMTTNVSIFLVYYVVVART